MFVQVLKRTTSVAPGRHGAGGDPPRSVGRPFRLEKPFMPSLQRIPVKPAVTEEKTDSKFSQRDSVEAQESVSLVR